MTKYKQCTLKLGTTQQVVWIPSKFAKVGHFLQIKKDEEWVDGWEVLQVSETEVEEKLLPDSHKAIKHHRKKTGDSMRKTRTNM